MNLAAADLTSKKPVNSGNVRSRQLVTMTILSDLSLTSLSLALVRDLSISSASDCASPGAGPFSNEYLAKAIASALSFFSFLRVSPLAKALTRYGLTTEGEKPLSARNP